LSDRPRTLGRMAGQATSVDDMVQGIEVAVCEGLDQLLRTTGAVQAPTVHMFATEPEPAYLGLVTCRRFYPGDDAHRGIGKLGDLPGALEATRLLVTWEAQDLNVALEVPVDPDGSALIVVDATMDGQTLRFYPLRFRRARPGHLALIPEWLPPQALADPPLPAPITRALALWRLARGGVDVVRTAHELEADGYRIGWFGQ